MERKKDDKDKIAEAFSNPDVVTRAIMKGVREALLSHKRGGFRVVIWRDGKTVWLKPEEIPS